MSFTESIKTCLEKFIDFKGRASRSEYWWFVLLTFVLGFIPIIGWILRLVLLLPSLSVQVRRLHDTGRSAWWLLLLVPPISIIGVFVLLIMSIFPGTPRHNRYGPNPLRSQQGNSGFDYSGSSDPLAPTDLYASPPAEGEYYGAIPASQPDPDPEPEHHRFCTQCGMQMQPEARFCTVCGTAA